MERNAYKPFAGAGADMFFLICDLRVVNHMYQFSLPVFLWLFKKTLGSAGSF